MHNLIPEADEIQMKWKAQSVNKDAQSKDFNIPNIHAGDAFVIKIARCTLSYKVVNQRPNACHLLGRWIIRFHQDNNMNAHRSGMILQKQNWQAGSMRSSAGHWGQACCDSAPVTNRMH